METMYEDMSRAIFESRTHLMVKIGDFNAKLGIREKEELRVRQFEVGKRNPRGQRLADLMESENLYMMNSFFKKRPHRKWTWMSPDGNTKNEIDFILTTKRQIFNDVTVISRLKTGSDYRMFKTQCSFLKTHICTLGLSLTLINSVRLPREAFRYGAVPYLVVYSLWLLVVGLAASLLQLATGQLSQQGPVGVWRAVPILRGVGHLQITTSFLCCVYNMLYVALAAAYIIWIGKDTFPLRMCTKIQMTPDGYENKMNATECYSSTFLSSFVKHPEYLGIMAIITFLLWFFVPLFLYNLEKSYKISMSIITPFVMLLPIIVCAMVAHQDRLDSMLISSEHWIVYTDPNIWFSTLVQALMSTQVMSGHLISAGGTVYKNSDVRLVAVALVSCNFLSGWLWVLFWQSIGGIDDNDSSFVAILVLIYQSSLNEKRTKLWPILMFGIVFLSGLLTIYVLLYPVYDRLHHLAADRWKIVATLSSALGTTLTLAVLLKAVHVATVLDELVVPALIIFSTTMQVLGFVFIYGCGKLRVDVEFLTNVKTSIIWVIFWCLTPLFLVFITGWWLRDLLWKAIDNNQSLWPLGVTMLGVLLVMSFIAAIAVAKEEQFNMISKITSAFKPSRLWGPENPTTRYNWMIYRNPSEEIENIEGSSANFYDNIPESYRSNLVKSENSWYNAHYDGPRSCFYVNDIPVYTDSIYATYVLNKNKKKVEDDIRNTTDCVVDDVLDSRSECKCSRHFTLNIPIGYKTEASTVL